MPDEFQIPVKRTASKPGKDDPRAFIIEFWQEITNLFLSDVKTIRRYIGR